MFLWVRAVHYSAPDAAASDAKKCHNLPWHVRARRPRANSIREPTEREENNFRFSLLLDRDIQVGTEENLRDMLRAIDTIIFP